MLECKSNEFNDYFIWTSCEYSIETDNIINDLEQNYPEKILLLQGVEFTKMNLNNYIQSYAVTIDNFDPTKFKNYIEIISGIFK